MAKPRALYIQFTNPAGYPPLEYSSEILVEFGYNVLFIGICTPGTENIIMHAIRNREVNLWPGRYKGIPMILYYIFFLVWAIYKSYRYHPDIVYISDLPGAPIAWVLIALGWRNVVYHEHDSPDLPPRGMKQKTLLLLRNHSMKYCAAVIAPNRERLRVIEEQVPGLERTFCVWNCPRRKMVIAAPAKSRRNIDTYRIVFHGSITPDNLPSSSLNAVAKVDSTELHVIGYEAPGARGYIAELKSLADELGIVRRVHFYGAMPHHKVLLKVANSHLGFALLTNTTTDINRRHMVGASNKVFDNLSMGVPVLVPDEPEWVKTFVSAGVARACDPLDACSIAAQIQWAINNPEELAEMGRKGVALCQSNWNYDDQFQPVLDYIETSIIEEKGYA